MTPFCSCSAIPLFIGFMTAGVPLGVTFSFLISAPMVNEIALVMLYGLLGWKIAALYFCTGVAIAIVAGWVLGRLRLEKHVEDWVKEIRAGEGADPSRDMSLEQRVRYAWDSVRDIIGRVWKYVVLGIAVGAGIHGYVPEGYLAGVMGGSAWWSVPFSVLIGIPMYTNAAGVIPVIDALLGKGRGPGHRAGLHDERHRPVLSRDGHPQKGSEAAPHRRVHRRGGLGNPAGGISFQRDHLITNQEKTACLFK